MDKQKNVNKIVPIVGGKTMEKISHKDVRFRFRTDRSTMKESKSDGILSDAGSISLMILRSISFALIVLGILIFLFSLVNNISYPVLGQRIHGSIWGFVIAFLGVRYFVSVNQLRRKLLTEGTQTSKTPVVRKGAV